MITRIEAWAKVGPTIRATAAAEAAVLKAQTAEQWYAAKAVWEHAKIVEAAAWALAEQQTDKAEEISLTWNPIRDALEKWDAAKEQPE